MAKTRKKPYLNKDLFNVIVDVIKEEGLLTDILEYYRPDPREFEIRTYEWDVYADLFFGTCEGIFLDLYIQGNLGYKDAPEKIWLGSFKTLRTDLAALKELATLQAYFIWYCKKFVDENIDDFEWTGYKVEFYKGDQKTVGYSTAHRSGVNNLIKRNFKYEWDYVIITTNTTQKEKKYNKEDIVLD